jgi:hypothetical protein
MEDRRPEARLSTWQRVVVCAGAIGSVLTLTACGGDSLPAPSHETSISQEATAPTTDLPSPTEAKHEAPIAKRTDALQPGEGDYKDEDTAALADLEQRGNLLQKEAPFDGAMRFFPMPDENTSWCSAGVDVFMNNGLRPVFVLEPNGDTSLLDGHDPAYDRKVKAFYESLSGSASNKDVTFVVVPEPHAGSDKWHEAPSKDYTTMVRHQAELIHTNIPSAKVNALLDLNEDPEAYFVQLPQIASSVDGFTVQAFSNGHTIKMKNGPHGLEADVSKYMDPEKIIHINKQLGNKPISINTGIPRLDHGKVYTTTERTAIAEGIVANVRHLLQQGVLVSDLILYAPDNTHTENIDYSFDKHDAETILPSLIKKLNELGVRVTGFAVTGS